MAQVNVYLNFDGNCEEAFNFYKSVFGGEFSYIGRFKDMPPSEGDAMAAPVDAEKIMHVGLPISKETALMGSDVVVNGLRILKQEIISLSPLMQHPKKKQIVYLTGCL
jgi:PhnB protein